MKKKTPTREKVFCLSYPDKMPVEEVLSSTAPARLEEVGAFFAGNDGGWTNMLISGDNLPVLKTLVGMKKEGAIRNSDGSVGARLIYIDPPFSTSLVFRDGKNRKAYDDRVVGVDFIEFLRRRLIFMRELLCDNGTIYVHLDWKMAHRVKAVMDECFGAENFLNDIIWHYGGRGAKAVAGQFSRNHDIILWYRKGRGHVFNRLYAERRVKKGGAGFRMDEEGRWFKTSPRGDYSDRSVAALSREGRVYRTKNGVVRVKYFLREDGDYLIEDRLVGDVWDDIPDAMHLGRSEKTGYPTQKPEALLRRVISASTMPGDLVIDAFAGAGTTLVAAERLGRRWIGIDSGRLSLGTIRKRLLGMDGGCGRFKVLRAVRRK